MKSFLRLSYWDGLLLSSIAILTILMVTYPAVFVVLKSISTDEIGSEFTTRWLLSVFNSNRSFEAIANTTIYTLGSTALSMFLGIGLSFLVTRTDMPGSRYVEVFSLMPMLVPPFI